jgi:hypothetical protein
MRFKVKTFKGDRFMESNQFTWLDLPMDINIKEVKIQGNHKSFEYVFKNASGFYLMKEAIATSKGSSVVSYIVGAIDKKRGIVSEYTIKRDGRLLVQTKKIDDFLKDLASDKFDSSIIREGQV